jgi:hypothetical protein
MNNEYLYAVTVAYDGETPHCTPILASMEAFSASFGPMCLFEKALIP